MPAAFNILRELADTPKHGSGTGLHRMAWLRRALGAESWLSGLDALKVTGSNGKGSVCSMLAAIFAHLPVSCGLYTSPHLRDFRERIVVGGEPISEEDLRSSWSVVERCRQAYGDRHPEDRFGAFEIFTALALHHFSRRQPSVVIAEAGIGGRYDPTRVIPGGLVALTSLDLEHADLLGDRLELIAYDKADLCPRGGTLVVGEGVDAETLRRLEGYARAREVRSLAVGRDCRLRSCRLEGTRMTVDMEARGRRWEEVEIALAGRHQWSNAAVALLLTELWVERHLPDLAEKVVTEAIRAGLREVSLAGRFQKVASDPEVYVDVGHTPAAARALVQLIRRALAERPILLVTGVSRNKQLEEIVSTLLEVADAVICTRAWHLGSSVDRVEEVVRARRPEVPRWRAETVDEAVALACEEARRRAGTVVVGGGLFLAIEASEVLRGNDPRRLRFF